MSTRLLVHNYNRFAFRIRWRILACHSVALTVGGCRGYETIVRPRCYLKSYGQRAVILRKVPIVIREGVALPLPLVDAEDF
jgi:hypothetical protein